MLQQKERWIYFYDKVLDPSPTDSPQIAISDLIKELAAKYKQEGVVKLIKNNTAAIRIRKITIDEKLNTATILIQLSDMNISDPVFGDLATENLRVEPKLEGEGVAVSAHMLVSLTPRVDDESSYLVLLESVPGLGKSKLNSFFTSIYKSFNYTFFDEDGKERRCWPSVDMLGHAAQSLRQDLQEGVLQGIELVQERTQVAEFDEPKCIKEIRRSISMKPEKPFKGDIACNIIEKLRIKAFDSNYSHLKVRYKKLEGKQRTIDIETSRADAIDVMYTKFELVKVDDALRQCEENIREDLENKMKKLLKKERLVNP